MTDGQLRSKRDEFWDTAPAFEGRKEIWDALKAAAYAIECNDLELAQAIVDGASIILPHGKCNSEMCNMILHPFSLLHSVKPHELSGNFLVLPTWNFFLSWLFAQSKFKWVKPQS